MMTDDTGDDERTAKRSEGPSRHAGTRMLLASLATGAADEQVPFRAVFSGLGTRAFGMLLFVATLPAFIPVPGVGGAISGPLAVLIGLQLLVGLRKPWLPGFIANRGLQRRTIIRFEDKMSPWLKRLERLVRPRWPALLDHRLATAFSGLLLVLLGLLLALPIPLTNYLFAVLLMLFALALLERDGALMTVAWLAGAIAAVVFGVVSGNLVAMLAGWVDGLF